MRVTGEFSEALEQVERSVSELDELLGTARRFVAARAVDTNADELGDRLEAVLETFEDGSARLGKEIVSAVTGSATPDDDAITRLVASIDLDLVVVGKVLEHAALEEESTEASAGPHTFLRSERALVADDVDGFVLGADDGPRPWTGSPTAQLSAIRTGRGDIHGGAAPTKVESAIDKVIADGASSIMTVAGAVTWLTPSQARGAIDALFGKDAGRRFDDLVDRLGRLWRRFTKWAFKILRVAVEKVAALLGKPVQDGLDAARNWIGERWDELPGDSTAGRLLGLAFDRGDLLADCAAKLDALPEAKRAAAEAAAERVANDHKKRQGSVDTWAAVLKFLGGISVIASSPWSAPVMTLLGGSLFLYALWLAHDHLDATQPGFLPNRVVGIAGAIGAV